jgi:hypothetical protein
MNCIALPGAWALAIGIAVKGNPGTNACNIPQFAAALVKHECAAAITARKRERT